MTNDYDLRDLEPYRYDAQQCPCGARQSPSAPEAEHWERATERVRAAMAAYERRVAWRRRGFWLAFGAVMAVEAWRGWGR